MKLYSCFTRSHYGLKEKWFEPTIQDDYELDIRYRRIHGHGWIMQPDWQLGIQFKVEVIIEAIRENMGDPFVWSDVDVQFFGPTKAALLENLADQDMVCQRDDLEGQICSGFFICMSNEKTLRLWEAVQDYCSVHYDQHDQHGLNHFLRRDNPFDVRWDYLPEAFYGPGLRHGQHGWLWEPGMSLEIPENGQILLHHANWTLGIENKNAQLEYVRKLVNDRSSVGAK